ATVAMCAWHRLSVEARLATEREIYHFLVVVLLISAPLVVLPQGYLRNGSGFQGVLNHPQVFGPSMALLASWTLSAVLSDARPSWKNLAILGVSMWFILASEARTAGLA